MKISDFYKIAFIFLLLQCRPTPKVAGQFTNMEFEQMAQQMAEGAVEDISTNHLDAIKSEVILLDTRALEEYEVSHMPNAIWVGYDDFTPERIQDLSKDVTIVVYCSVGYRSERIGEKIKRLGFEKVYNLEGSLFKWINEKRPIVDQSGNQTAKIHGYNKEWSKWIKNGQIVY